jgi:hypothetical protein
MAVALRIFERPEEEYEMIVLATLNCFFRFKNT